MLKMHTQLFQNLPRPTQTVILSIWSLKLLREVSLWSSLSMFGQMTALKDLKSAFLCTERDTFSEKENLRQATKLLMTFQILHQFCASPEKTPKH